MNTSEVYAQAEVVNDNPNNLHYLLQRELKDNDVLKELLVRLDAVTTNTFKVPLSIQQGEGIAGNQELCLTERMNMAATYRESLLKLLGMAVVTLEDHTK